MKKNNKVLLKTLILGLLLTVINPKFIYAAASEWCQELTSVWTLIGYVVAIAYVAAPLILIISGSIGMLKAMTQKDEAAITKAQNVLVKKIIAAVAVFLVVTITKLVVGIFGDGGWMDCAKCVLNPREPACKIEIFSGGESSSSKGSTTTKPKDEENYDPVLYKNNQLKIDIYKKVY